MQDVIRMKPLAPYTPPARLDVGREKAIKYVRGLIWTYFILLIFEGSLRKWILPQFSDVLLVVRDPVVLAIYAFAIRGRVFPNNGYVVSLGIMGVLCWLVSLVVLQPYLSLQPLILVTGFGFRSNFLHLPMIFIIGKVLDHDDLLKLGKWILIGSIPMALLLAIQFSSAPGAFINRTVGLGETLQIGAGGDKIRPPGTFSFTSGVVFCASLSATFLLYGGLSRGVYRNWLLFSAGFALMVMIGVSGSRSVLLAVVVVIASLVAIIFVRPSALNQFGRNLLIVVAVLFLVTRGPGFQEGSAPLSPPFFPPAEAGEKNNSGGVFGGGARGIS